MSLHDDIMNIPAIITGPMERERARIYETGHRDARHAAAELAVKVDAEIKRLTAENAELRAQLESLRKKDCTCRACRRANPSRPALMSLCPECGDKRCPRAEDHRNSCMNQDGSSNA